MKNSGGSNIATKYFIKENFILNFEDMTFDEVKEIAKQKGIKFGNISKEKLIEKIQAELDDNTVTDDVTETVEVNQDAPDVKSVVENKTDSTLSSIISAIDDLEETDDSYVKETFEELPLDTMIPVRSLTFGTLIYKSPSNNAVFIWNEIGSTQYMSIANITEMNNYNPNFLRKPLVVLLDDRAVKQFRLTPVYENVAKINDLKKLFKSDMSTIAKTIDDALRVNMRDILISKVRTLYKNKSLTDINVIRLLEKKLQFDLSDDN